MDQENISHTIAPPSPTQLLTQVTHFYVAHNLTHVSYIKLDQFGLFYFRADSFDTTLVQLLVYSFYLLDSVQFLISGNVFFLLVSVFCSFGLFSYYNMEYGICHRCGLWVLNPGL